MLSLEWIQLTNGDCRMKRKILTLLAAASLAGLTSCAGATWNVKIVCKPDGDCHGEGSIGGTIPPRGNSAPLSERLLHSASVVDAADFELDVSGSSFSYPASGAVTLILTDRATNSIQAARQFGWVRTGTILRLADPDAVNDWAAAEGGTANDLTYKLAPVSARVPGEHFASIKTRYDGVVRATATTTFTVCTKHPSPYPCMQ